MCLLALCEPQEQCRFGEAHDCAPPAPLITARTNGSWVSRGQPFGENGVNVPKFDGARPENAFSL